MLFRSTALSDLRWVLPLGVLLYRRFKEGKPLQAYEAAEGLMLPGDVTGQLLEALGSAGVVHAARGGGYSLARPAGEITAFDLLAAARGLCQVPPELAREKPTVGTYPSSAALLELEGLEGSWALNHSLAELAGEVAGATDELREGKDGGAAV